MKKGENVVPFEEKWNEVMQLGVLPEAAHIDLPGILSDETKAKLSNRSIKEIAEICLFAISEVDSGSIETINNLVKQRLEC